MTMTHDQTDTASSKLLSNSNKRKGDKLDAGKPVKKSKHCRASKAKWSPEEDEILSRAVMVSGEGNWKKIAQSLNDRSHLQCLHRWQKVLNPALVKGPWKEEEDAKLTELVEKYGPKDWSTIASHIPGRIGKQCRERWFNHLSPDVRKTNWTPEEDKIIIEAHSKIGNKWTNISKLLEGRPANAIKNHWNSTLLKRIQDSNGETTPRRDRTRNKKSVPMRATEFDFRTQLHRQLDDSSDSSPHQYSLSPSSSPEMPYQESPMVNTVRFQYPTQEAGAHLYFPFNEHNTTLPAHNSYTSAAWDNWPAPHIIHLTPSVSSASVHAQSTPAASLSNVVSSVSHGNNNLSFGQTIGQAFNGFPHSSHNATVNAPPHTYDVEYGLGLHEHSGAEEFIDMYAPPVQNSTLPAELQYCFDHPQQVESLGVPTLSSENFNPLSMETSSGGGMNSINVPTMSNMGLLSLDMPGFCPLDL